MTAASRGIITAIIIKKGRERKCARKGTRKSERGRETDTEKQIEIIAPLHKTTEGKRHVINNRLNIYTGDEEEIEKSGHYGSMSADVESGPYSHTDGSNADREERKIRNKEKKSKECIDEKRVA